MIYIKHCKKCKRAYDYPRCPYCNWPDKEKLKEVEIGKDNRDSKSRYSKIN